MVRSKSMDLSRVFPELELQVKLGRHEQEELDALKKQYQCLTQAYYRGIRGADGESVDEGGAIYNKYSKLAHPEAEKAEKFNNDEQAQARAEARGEALKKRMLALQAKGDYAGMMKLSQESASIPAEEAGISEEEATPGAKDNWDIWVKCMQELKAAAYWTQIKYERGALEE